MCDVKIGRAEPSRPHLDAHVSAIGLPEATHRRLGDAVVVGGDARAAHLHDRKQIGGRSDRALHEAGRRAILHRNISGRADQVGFPQATLGHVRVVGGEAEAGPHQLGLVEALRTQAPHRQAVAGLLQHEGRKHGENLQPDPVPELVDGLQQLRRLQAESFLRRAHAGLLVFLAASVGGERVAHVVAARIAHHDAALLRQPVEPKGGEERVQQARVVGVLDVFHIELPIARQRLAVAAEDLHRRAHHAADAGDDLGPEIALERRRVRRKRPEHQARERLQPQLARPVSLGAALLRHAAPAAQALTEGDAGEVAAKIVAPVVVDADDIARLAALVEHQQRSAMRAAVLEGVKRAVPVAGHHHRHRTEARAAIAIGVGQLGLETEEMPGRPAKDARLLLLVDVAIRIDPIGYPGETFRRPAASLRCNRHGVLSSALSRHAHRRRGARVSGVADPWMYAGLTSHSTDCGPQSTERRFATVAAGVLNSTDAEGAAEDARKPGGNHAARTKSADRQHRAEQSGIRPAGDRRHRARAVHWGRPRCQLLGHLRRPGKGQCADAARLKENLFDCGSADSYNVCEWASIDRLERGKRGGNIAALRAAVAAQAILTFDDKLQVPRDMADVPVMVQELTGSHYTTIQMLESAVGSEHVKLQNGGLPQMRYAALKDGTARAIAVMEPFISLGLKEGAHIIAASFYRGGEVISADLTPEQRKAYYDAENEAVDLINADFYKYAHHVTAHAKGALKPTELLRTFVRYKHVDYYDVTLFNRAYDWMKARGMSEGQSQHAALVVG